MVAVEQHQAARSLVARAVGEGKSRRFSAERIERAVMGDAAQRQDGPQAGQGGDPAARNCRQVAISPGVGLFSGGTQRTALVIMQSMSVRPHRARGVVAPAREARP